MVLSLREEWQFAQIPRAGTQLLSCSLGDNNETPMFGDVNGWLELAQNSGVLSPSWSLSTFPRVLFLPPERHVDQPC